MLLHSLRIQGFLSFGPGTPDLALDRLNILIGPNGSGKSNLIEAIDLLRHAPSTFRSVFRGGGSIRDWLWKGKTVPQDASIEATVANPDGHQHLKYRLVFTEEGQQFALVDENIENEHPYEGHEQAYFYYRLNEGAPLINVRGEQRALQREQIEVNRSILAQRRDPEQYPEITYFAETLEDIRIYRDWSFGRHTAARLPQEPDLPTHFLEPDAGNLGLVLNRLERDPAVKNRLLERLRALYDGIDDYNVQIEGGSVQVYFHENGANIPATRLSDGTLRYLSLLTILCHPEPPPLVAIEEPELGLHPDILPTVAELLEEAAERTQLLVTTHSDILVDALNHRPEDIVVCER
ncbi:MAG: AAA family ATPase, partial [Halorhodospira sp.]